MSQILKEMEEIDLYELLNIKSDSDISTIQKAFRKKALLCHPDKNPDDPKAVALFHQLSKALEILIDSNTRTEYDNKLNAKKAAETRHKELDADTRFFKDNLRRREDLFQNGKATSYHSEVEKETERLRDEGARLLDEEIKYMTKLASEKKPECKEELKTRTNTIKAQWDPSKIPDYTRDDLNYIFGKYGDLSNLFISKKKKATAVIEFVDPENVELAVRYEVGIITNPLKVVKLND